VVVLTDDLDLMLGGWKASALAKTRALIANQGVVLTKWFLQTPVCCPSRAELLTGKYFHNLWTPHANDKGCMHVDAESSNTSKFYQNDYFTKYFQQLNYTVGILENTC
jgi:N-acetylglucosamine-6-sulfatase